jgi:hypothetical protein
MERSDCKIFLSSALSLNSNKAFRLDFIFHIFVNPIDRFFRDLDRTLEGIQRETVEHLIDYTKWLAVQVILDAFVGKVLSVFVNLFFVLFTFYGLLVDTRNALDATKSAVRFALATFAFIIDVWLMFL